MSSAAATRDVDSVGWKRIDRMPLSVIAVVFLLLLFLRHPAGILHANFWAEDGWLWYPDAYRFGVRCLIIPSAGYLQTVSRLGGLVAQLTPLLWAPTVFAAIALAIQVLPAVLLLSRRFDAVWPQYWSRLLFALVFIGMPNSFETFGNLTNSQWYLAILSCLILIGPVPRGRAGRWGDCLALALSGLSGPFAMLLAPIALWVWWCDRQPDRLRRLVIVLITGGIQCVVIMSLFGHARPHVVLAFGLINLCHILAMKMAYGLIVGSHMMHHLYGNRFWCGDLAASILAAAVVIALVLACWRGTALFRRFAAFGGLVLVTSLMSPLVTGSPAWVVLAAPIPGGRYFLIPNLVLAAAFFTLAADRRLWLSRCGLTACLALTIGVVGDFPYPHMRATDFDVRALAFAVAPPGTRMTFPVLPIPHADMSLVKK